MAKRVTNEELSEQVANLTKIVTNLLATQTAAAAVVEAPPVALPEKNKSAVGYTPPRIVAQPVNGKLKEVSGSKPITGVVARAARAELWAYDEYQQGSIIGQGQDLVKLAADAKRFVTEANVDNALTLDEKDNQWEAYFPEIWKNGAPDPNAYYAGNKQNGQPYYYLRGKDGSWSKEPLSKDVELRFFLGQINRGRVKDDWYLADFKGNEIADLKSSLLERKTVLFIKILG